MANQNFRVKHGLEVGTAITATASSGILTATEFHGDGSNLTNINAGNLSGVATDSNLLEGQNGSYYLDYANFSGIATDSDKLDGQQGSYYLDTSATGQTKVGDLTLSKSGTPNLVVQTSNNSGQDALIKIRGARTSSSTSDIAMLQFDNKTSSAYTMAQISAMDPAAAHADGKGKLVFRTATGGTLSDKFTIDDLSTFSSAIISDSDNNEGYLTSGPINPNGNGKDVGFRKWIFANAGVANTDILEGVDTTGIRVGMAITENSGILQNNTTITSVSGSTVGISKTTLGSWQNGYTFTVDQKWNNAFFGGTVVPLGGIRMPKDAQIRIGGDPSDAGYSQGKLRIYNDGTDNWIHNNNNGDTKFFGSSFIFCNGSNGSSQSAEFGSSKAILKYDSNNKLETTDSGVTVTGILTATTFSGSGASLTNIPTSSLVGLATDSDKLDGQQGSYYLDYANFSGIATDSDKLDGQQGSYYLDYANFSGIATDSSLLDGIDSASFLRSDAADTKSSGDLTLSDDVILKLGDSGDGNIVSTGSTLKVYSGAGADWEFFGRGAVFKFGRSTSTSYSAGEDRLIINTDAGVELYHGNTSSSTKKFETTNSGANVIGILTATESTIIGTTLPTGTASQNLQVVGSAYVSANLGIGVTNPTHKLSVSGDINLNNSSIIASDGGTSNIDHLWHSDTSAYGQGGVWHFVSDSTYKANGTSAIRAGAFVNMADTGTASQKLQITGGAYVSGDVGIGTTNPTAKLDVDGTLNVTGLSTFRDYLRVNANNSDSRLYVGSGPSSNQAELRHTNGYSYLYHYGNNTFHIALAAGSTNKIQFDTISEKMCEMYRNGSVNLYYDGSEKFATTSAGISVSGIVTATSGIVTYYGDGSNLTGIVTNITAGSNISIAENPTGNFIITATSSGGMSELLDDTTPQLGGDLDTNGNNIIVQTLDSNGNNVLNIGSSSGDRMQIYKLPAAQGGHTVFAEDDANGSLVIKANQIIFNNQAGTEIKAQFIDDGSCILNYDNSRRIRTTGYGISVYGGGLFTGISTFEGAINANGNVVFGDDDFATFGASNDLLIYHAVSTNVDHVNESYLTAQNGGLNLEANSGGHVRIKGPYQSGTLAKFNDGGAAELYHDGSKKLETTNAGVTITGITTSTSFVKASNSGGFLKADGTEDTNTYLTSETSHADVLVDGDFTSNGFMKRTGAGTYAIDNNTYLTSYAETDTLDSVTTRGSTTTNNVGVGTITATEFVKSGGQSTEFLKADGSVDSSTYLTSYSETDTLDTVTGRGNITTNTIEVGGVDLLDLGTLDFGGTSGGARDVQVFYDGTNSDFEITLQSDVETMTIRDGTSSRVAIAKTTGKVAVHGPVQVGAGTSGTTQELLLIGGDAGILGEIDIYKTDYILNNVGAGNTISFFSLDKQKYRAAKVSITVRLDKGSGVVAYQYTELMIMHDSTSTNAFITEVNTICTEEPFAVFESPSAANSSTSMFLWCRNTSSSYNINSIRGVATCIAGV